MDTRCQFLYRLQPARIEMLTQGPTPEEARVIGEHFGYLTDAAAHGHVLLFGRTQTTDESTFGLALLRFSEMSAAEAFMNNDPAVKAGVMHARLFPFKIAGGCFTAPS